MHKLASKSQYENVTASVEDRIVTLTGTVNLFQQKLDAAKLARKIQNSQGVRNLITVAGPSVPDAQLEEKLANQSTATLAISGGSTPKLLFAELAKSRFDWSKVHLFWVDERAVPPTDQV